MKCHANPNRLPENGLPQRFEDLVEETPLAISVNHLALSVMMVSPHDLEDFLTGFFLTERIIKSPLEVKDIDIRPAELGLSANISLTGRREHLLKLKRFSAVSAGCGICNKTAMEQAFPPLESFSGKPVQADIDYASLREAVARHQQLGRHSGALHAAAFFSAAGELLILREDIGRHNALDKVIGAVSRAGHEPAGGFLVITSRCGVELVQKAASGGFSRLISFSSPTGFAVQFAHQTGVELIFLPRNNTPIIYQWEADNGR